jgi:integrase
MASKEARNGGTFRIRWREDGKVQAESFDEERQADAFRTLVERNGNRWPDGWVRGKGDVAADGDTVTTWLETYFGNARYHKKMQAHVRAHQLSQIKVRLADHYLADTRLSMVRVEDIQSWADVMAGRYSHNTIVQSLHTLSASFKPAVRAGKMAATFALSDIEIDVAPREFEHRPLTEIEEADIVDAMADVAPEWSLLTRLLFESGLRFGEAWALYGLNVRQSHEASDLAVITVSQSKRREKQTTANPTGLVYGKTKNKKSRTVTVAGSLALDLLAHARSVGPRGMLFPDLDVAGRYYRVWRTALDRAGITGTLPRIHDMRHTHAVRMIQNGMPLHILQRRLGHSNLDITNKTYVGYLPEDTVTHGVIRAVSAQREHLHAA